MLIRWVLPNSSITAQMTQQTDVSSKVWLSYKKQWKQSFCCVVQPLWSVKKRETAKSDHVTVSSNTRPQFAVITRQSAISGVIFSRFCSLGLQLLPLANTRFLNGFYSQATLRCCLIPCLRVMTTELRGPWDFAKERLLHRLHLHLSIMVKEI